MHRALKKSTVKSASAELDPYYFRGRYVLRLQAPHERLQAGPAEGDAVWPT